MCLQRDKDCEINEELKDWTGTKTLIHDLGVTCNEIIDTAETASINSNNNENNTPIFLIGNPFIRN